MDDKQLVFKELAEKILKEKKRPLTSKEIWDIAKEKGYDKLCKTKGTTPWKTINAYIYVDMRDNEKSPFMKLGAMPRRFFLKSLFLNENDKKEAVATAEKPEKVTAKTDIIGYEEKDLHPFLTYYAETFIGIYTKTINHQKSNKNHYAQWLHPDMVGIRFPFDEVENKEALEFAKEIGSMPLKLYSFEIKRNLNFNNIRESFFQAVSNSSWANGGYLVASNIDNDSDFNAELERLSSAFGIGIIELDIKDPDSSETLYQPKYRKDLDWSTISKLSEINKDFKNFLEKAKNAIKINKSTDIDDNYDKLYKTDVLVKNMKQIIKKNTK